LNRLREGKIQDAAVRIYDFRLTIEPLFNRKS
jgi:hypothetical protein